MTRGRPASSDRLARLTVAAILALYLTLALIYNAATPIFEASDEFRHYTTIRYLALTHRLPVLQPSDDPFAPWQEAGQPPLYYLAGAALTGWIDTGDIAEADFNPHAEAGIPSTSPDNKDLFVHAASEDFPYHGVSLAAHLARLLSIALGAGTVYLTWRLARTVAPASLAVAILATSLVAFNPQFLFVSASVDNDNLITFAAAAALLLMAAMLLRGVTRARLWGLSGLLGVATLSKLSGLGLPILAAIVAALPARRRAAAPFDMRMRGAQRWARRWTPILGRWLILAAGPLVIAGWWFARNWAIYGEPTGLRAWAELVHTRAPSALEVLREAPGLFLSYWGVFGAFDIQADVWVYVLYGALCLLGVAGLVLARERIGKELPSWAPVWLLAGWFAVELLALVRWTTVASASSGRLLFPAIGGVATLLALGLVVPLTPSFRWPAAGAVSALLLVLAAFLPFRYIFPAYSPPIITTAPGAAPSHPVQVDYAGKLRLLGYDVSAASAAAGQDVLVGLHWQVVADVDQNYSVTVQLLTADGLAGQYDSFPGQGRIATRHLRSGEYFRDTYRVRILPSVQAPAIARLKVGFYGADLTKLPARDASGAELAEPFVGELAIAGTPPPAPPPLATFGDGIELLPGSAAPPSAKAGQTVDVDLHWRATQRPSRPETVFVHLADAAGRPIAQHDSPPREGAFPTTLWAAGQLVQDTVRLAVPDSAEAGQYQVLVGLYDSATQQRLAVSAGGDAYRLGTLDVSR